MEHDPIRMCELLVGLPDVNIVGVVDDTGGPLWIHIETRGLRPCCPGCNGVAYAKDRRIVELVDLPAFGRPTRLMWRKRRWVCPTSSCPTGTWTEEVCGIAAPRLALTDRAGRWVTEQVGRNGRTVNDVAVCQRSSNSLAVRPFVHVFPYLVVHGIP